VHWGWATRSRRGSLEKRAIGEARGGCWPPGSFGVGEGGTRQGERRRPSPNLARTGETTGG
jgi:hypothetical protein